MVTFRSRGGLEGGHGLDVAVLGSWIMPSDGNGEYVTVADAARLLGFSVLTLHRWIRDGRIPSEMTDGGQRVLRKADLGRVAVQADDPPPPRP